MSATYLSDAPSVDSDKISDGVVADFDAKGNLVGIEDASRKVNLGKLILSNLPGEVETVAA